MIDWTLVGIVLVSVVLPLIPVIYVLYGVLKSIFMMAKSTTYDPFEKYKDDEK